MRKSDLLPVGGRGKEGRLSGFWLISGEGSKQKGGGGEKDFKGTEDGGGECLSAA